MVCSYKCNILKFKNYKINKYVILNTEREGGLINN